MSLICFFVQAVQVPFSLSLSLSLWAWCIFALFFFALGSCTNQERVLVAPVMAFGFETFQRLSLYKASQSLDSFGADR